MKRLIHGLMAALTLLWATSTTPALAQQGVQYFVVASCGTNTFTPPAGTFSWGTMTPDGKFCDQGSSGGGSLPFTVVGASTPITTGASSGNTALPATSTILVLTNNGSNDLYFKLGTSNAVTAASTDAPLQAGHSLAVAVGLNSYIAAISPSGASTLQVIGGTGGNPAIAGGGGTGSTSTGGDTSKKLISSTLTRIANNTAYSGTTTSPQAVCLFTSTTACAPLTMTVSTNNTVNGVILNLRLEKSTTLATAASFRILVYQATPTLTSVFDATVYNPKFADITASPTGFIGYWTCGSQQVNTDNSTYECVSTSSDGHQAFQLTDGTLRFVVETTGAYGGGSPSISGETYNVIADLQTTTP